VIELTDWLRAELALRSDQEAPEECCGLISRSVAASPGAPGKLALWAAENVAQDPTAGFKIDAETLLGTIKQIDARNEKLVGVYHSHPGGEIAPSPDDVTTAALWPGLTWIIIGKRACPNCSGGYVLDVEPECCGNTTTSGECRGDCAVPKPVETPCPNCEGGEIPDFWIGVLA
jgi:proteasome lid subunit RPN8/RPN11